MNSEDNFPDINGILDSLEKSVSHKDPKEEPTKEENILLDVPSDYEQNPLWDEFIDQVHEDRARVGRRPYMIDNDIVATFDQCDIDGYNKTHLINSILRVFIKANIDRFKEYPKELIPSILDQCVKEEQ